MLQTLIDQKTVKPGNWSSLTVFLWFQLSKMGYQAFYSEEQENLKVLFTFPLF